MSASNKQSAAQGPPSTRYSNSPYQPIIGSYTGPDQYSVTSPAGSYVSGAQGPAPGPGSLRVMPQAGPPNQASTPPNSDLKVQALPSQMTQMPQFLQQVRPPSNPYYNRGAAPSSQGTRMPGHQPRAQAPTQYVLQSYMPQQTVAYLTNPAMVFAPNAQNQQPQRFVAPSFPVYSPGQQLHHYQPTYMQPQATAAVPAGYQTAIYFQQNQGQPMMARAPVQQPTAAPSTQASTGSITAAQYNIPPPPNPHSSNFTRSHVKERRKYAVEIIDPLTGTNVLNEILNENSSQPTSGESSARHTPKPNQNAAKEIQANFMKQVAERINEETSKPEDPLNPPPPSIHHEQPSYPPSNEYHHPPAPPHSNPPQGVPIHGQIYDIQTSNLHINAKEFISSSKLSAKDTTPVVSANTDAIEVFIPKKESSPSKARKPPTTQPTQPIKVEPVKEVAKEVSPPLNCDSSSGAVVKDNKPQESGATQHVNENIGAINLTPLPPVSIVEEVKEKKVEPKAVEPVAPVVSPASKDTSSNAKSKNNAQRQNLKNASQPAPAAVQQPQIPVKQQSQPVPVVPAPQPPKTNNKASKKSDINSKGANKEGTDMDAFNDNASAKNEVNANSILSSQNDLLNANTITAQQNDADTKTAAVPPKTEKETNANSISNHKPPLDNEKPSTINKASEPITTNHVAQAISTVTVTASVPLPKPVKPGFDVVSIVKETHKLILPPFAINHNNTQDEPDRVFVPTDKINANHVANASNKDGGKNGSINYPEGHWSPENPDGKRKYGRDFLLTLKDVPASKVKPNNLPDSVNADDRNRMIDGRLSMGGRTDFTNPPFMGQGYGTKGSQTRDGRGTLPKQRNSQSKMGPRGSEKGNKPIAKVSISLRADVKLHETENAWKPARFVKGEAMSDEDKKTETLYRKVRAVLNKLTPQKFSTLVNQVRQLNIDNKERLQGVIDLVFEKAIDEPNFSVAYAMMCKELQIMQVPTEAKPGDEKKPVAFKHLLVTRCQQEFEKQSVDETDRNGRLKAIEECSDPEKKKELEFELGEYDRRIRMRSVGCIRFIGELFKQQMLTASIMKRCLQSLLTNGDEESLECLCKLLTTVGKELEATNVNELSGIFDEMKRIAENKKVPRVSSRIRFMLQDVIDLRNSRWIPRRNDMNPKTIDQIQREAETEQLNIHVANMTPRKDDRGGGGGGGGRSRGQGDSRGSKMSDDGWNSVGSRNRQTYTIQTDKLRTKAPSMDEPLSLGSSQSFANWGKGSLGAKHTPPPHLNNMYAALENIDADKKLGNSRGGYSSKGPSMERTYKSSYDGRGSNSRSGSQHRPVDNVPMRMGGSSMQAPPPPVVQQAPAPVAPRVAPQAPPKMTEEQQERRIHNSLDEYLTSCCSVEEYWQDITAAVSPNEYPKVVTESYNKIIEKSQKARLKTGELFAGLIFQNMMTLEDFCSGFTEFLAYAEDLEIDIPKIWAYIAENIVHLIYNEVLPFSQLKTLFSVIIESDRAKRVLKPLFDLVISEKGPNFLQNVWLKSQVHLSDFMKAEEVDAFIKDNDLGFLNGGESPVGQSGLSYDQIHEKLLEFFRKKATFDDITNWISANVGDRINENKFIRVLATCIFEDSIAKNKLVPEVLAGHGRLIQKYVDANVELELQCLYALQALVNRLEHPQGLLLAICNKMYDDSIFSQESFIMWESSSDPAEQGGKGVALKQLTSFFTQLKENEEDEEYSSNSDVET